MEKLNGVGAGSGASGADAPQPSTAEREDFFSGQAAWPVETAQSPKTESGSARAEGDLLSAAEQSGGGGGECPLLAPAPDGRITIREAIEQTQPAWMPPERLVIDLMFAARQATASSVMRLNASTTWCRECGAMAANTIALKHEGHCRMGRMQRVLDELEGAAAAAAEPAPSAPEAIDPEENFFEPWNMDVEHPGSVTDSVGREVYDCAGATEVHEDELDRYARRVRACVNFCAGVPTQKLEDAALLESLQGEVARLKGGAR